MARSLTLVFFLLWAVACEDGGGGGDASAFPTSSEGWSMSGDFATQPSVWACLYTDGTMALGDSAGDMTRPRCCTWDPDGTFEIVENPDVPGTWSKSLNTLTLNLLCTGEGCGTVLYRRDSSIDCDAIPEAGAPMCQGVAQSCETLDCCEGLYCVDSLCSQTPKPCAKVQESCADNDCCDGLSCGNGICFD